MDKQQRDDTVPLLEPYNTAIKFRMKYGLERLRMRLVPQKSGDGALVVDIKHAENNATVRRCLVLRGPYAVLGILGRRCKTVSGIPYKINTKHGKDEMWR